MDISNLKDKMEKQNNELTALSKDVTVLNTEVRILQASMWQKAYNEYQYRSVKPIDYKEFWIRNRMIQLTGDRRITLDFEKTYPQEYINLHKQLELEYVQLFGDFTYQ